ncbi:hypothetical protein [Streptomyces caniscabiei]|uniref:hypothetical protein n=1 Tax=Streptomyces caniscabiei TaxID=2746961 RepID=UPI001872ADED|nr:hypothetical protein [Streptomyces caniscabiei]MBE4783926.1 hypothetical protein [Streptomyces caniscabiei]MBE4791575.1 hypothetical protein [Streptomyces caniscabiei]MDX3009188.1 hypothetical protein [Streptomyces caniscabiei]
MVDSQPQGETLPEIAARHGRAYDTLRAQWSRHPAWPDPIGKRGRFKIYDPTAVDRVIAEHFERQAAELEPARLYTAQELEDAGIGIKAGTIRADLTRNRWPEPDDTGNGVNRWTGQTVMTAMTGRRGYRRSTEG